VYWTGDVHTANAALSREHSNVAPVSPVEKAKTAVVSMVVAAGRTSIAVSGGVRSATVHVYVAIGGSTTGSTLNARTANVCSPSGNPEYVFGEVHGANVPLSRR
jgi:hypothetical protein